MARPKFTEAERAERFADYKRYLKTTMWKAIRGTALLRANWTCEWCKGTEHLHVHHNRYPRIFGTETPEMLQVLCSICHAEAHGRPYILCRAPKAQKQERKARLRDQKLAERAQKKAARQARAERWKAKTAPTPSLKDRFSVTKNLSATH